MCEYVVDVVGRHYGYFNWLANLLFFRLSYSDDLLMSVVSCIVMALTAYVLFWYFVA